MFERIAIDNYRCFTNFEFVPGRVNLLLGLNGSGKSSLFDAIDAIVDHVCGAETLDEIFPSSSLTRWDKRLQQRFEFDVSLARGLYRYVLVIRHDESRERATIEREHVGCDGRTLFEYDGQHVHLHRNDGTRGTSFPVRGVRSFLPQIEVRDDTRDLHQFLDYLRTTWSLRIDARNVEVSSLAEEPSIDRDGANFASWYRHVAQERPENLESLFTALRPAIPGFRALKLVQSDHKGRARDLVAAMAADGVGYEIDFDELSDGQRALVILNALLENVSELGCLMLDEPESHVGLVEIQPWLVRLCEAFTAERQVFIASHHPEVVNYMAAIRPFWFERPGGGPARVRAAVFDRESGLSASEQIARGLIGEA
jgi:predicted ATPase